MITPLELEKNEFKKTLGGYSRKSVDSFFSKVNEDYEKLYKENIELKDRIALLNEGIGQYKAMEDVLKNSMIAAQNAAEEIKRNAQEKAENILQEAEFSYQDAFYFRQGREELCFQQQNSCFFQHLNQTHQGLHVLLFHRE